MRSTRLFLTSPNSSGAGPAFSKPCDCPTPKANLGSPSKERVRAVVQVINCVGHTAIHGMWGVNSCWSLYIQQWTHSIYICCAKPRLVTQSLFLYRTPGCQALSDPLSVLYWDSWDGCWNRLAARRLGLFRLHGNHHPRPCFHNKVLYVSLLGLWSREKWGKCPKAVVGTFLESCRVRQKLLVIFKLSTNEVTRQKIAKVSGASHFTFRELFFRVPSTSRFSSLISVLSMFVLHLVRRCSFILGE